MLDSNVIYITCPVCNKITVAYKNERKQTCEHCKFTFIISYNCTDNISEMYSNELNLEIDKLLDCEALNDEEYNDILCYEYDDEENIIYAPFDGVPEVLEIPQQCRVIADEAFFEINSPLRELILNHGLRIIGESAFINSKQLEKVIIPDTLQEIGSYCFAGCTSLKSIRIPSHTVFKNTSKNIFNGCKNLTNIDLPLSWWIMRDKLDDAIGDCPARSIIRMKQDRCPLCGKDLNCGVCDSCSAAWEKASLPFNPFIKTSF